MSVDRLQVFGFQPDKDNHIKTLGQHSFIFGTIRNYENKDKEPGVLAKVLHKTGVDTPISAGYSDRNDFIEKVINPLTENLARLDQYFGEYIPPYYLEVLERESRNQFKDLVVPTAIYSYKVEETEQRTPEEQAQFESDFINFFVQCKEFIKAQYEANSYPMMLPDIKPDNFIFGSHMGSENKRLYFVDQYPPFVPIEIILKSKFLAQLEDEFPFIKPAVEEMFKYWEFIHE